MDLQLFLTFVLMSFVLCISPGPIVTLIIATGATQGVRSALTIVLGALLGNALLVGGIAFGLTWLLQSSAILFEIIRWGGATYLVWLGIQAWRHAGAPPEAPVVSRVHFARGFLVALSNPKTVAFFTAFLPQFVDPARPIAPQLAILCVVPVAIALVTDSAWAAAAGAGRGWFTRPSRAKWLARASGGMLIGGGIWLSLTRRPA